MRADSRSHIEVKQVLTKQFAMDQLCERAGFLRIRCGGRFAGKKYERLTMIHLSDDAQEPRTIWLIQHVEAFESTLGREYCPGSTGSANVPWIRGHPCYPRTLVTWLSNKYFPTLPPLVLIAELLTLAPAF